jgi:phytoene desaturase
MPISCTYRDLLGDQPARQASGEEAVAQALLPSLFVVHFGIKGTWPGIPHHMILFGPRYKGLLDDIYDPWRAAAGFLDLSAPPDRQRSLNGARGLLTFYALAPVAHQGKLPIDWEEVGPLL